MHQLCSLFDPDFQCLTQTVCEDQFGALLVHMSCRMFYTCGQCQCRVRGRNNHCDELRKTRACTIVSFWGWVEIRITASDKRPAEHRFQAKVLGLDI